MLLLLSKLRALILFWRNYGQKLDWGNRCQRIWIKLCAALKSPAQQTKAIDLREELCRELRKIFPNTQSNINRLSAGSKELELTFMQIASAMEDFPETCQKLWEASGKICMFDADSQMEDIAALVTSPLDYLHSIPEKIQELEKDLNATVLLIDELLKTENDLKRILSPMNLIRTYIKIESSMLEQIDQAVFLMLAKEIDSMQNSLAIAVTQDLKALSEINSTAQRLIQHLDFYCKKHHILLQQKQANVKIGLVELHQQIEKNHGQKAHFQDGSKKVKNEVSKLVTAVQGQDAINQKLCHLYTGVRTLLEGHQEVCVTEDEKAEESILRLLAFCRLESAHADAIVVDLTGCCLTINQVRATIGTVITSLEDQCKELLRQKEKNELSATEKLIKISRDLRHMLDAAVEEASNLNQLFAPLQTQAKTISSTIQEISFKMRLISLNTQVQAAHSGQGTGLEVIAQQAAKVASQTDILVLNVVKASSAIETNLKRVVAACEAIQQGGKSQQDRINSACITKEKTMLEMRETGLEEMTHSSKRMHQLNDWIHTAIKREPAIIGQLKTLSAMFNMIAYLIEGAYPNQDLSGVDLKTGHRAQGYSMASERKIHEMVLGITSAPSSNNCDIELFDEVPTPEADKGMDAALEISTTVSDSTNPTETGLADNIELF